MWGDFLNSDNLKNLLIKYDQKRNQAIALANQKKYEIYDKFPELEQVDNEINILSIKQIKNVLTSQDKSSVDELKNKITDLRKKRDKLLSDIL